MRSASPAERKTSTFERWNSIVRTRSSPYPGPLAAETAVSLAPGEGSVSGGTRPLICTAPSGHELFKGESLHDQAPRSRPLPLSARPGGGARFQPGPERRQPPARPRRRDLPDVGPQQRRDGGLPDPGRLGQDLDGGGAAALYDRLRSGVPVLALL